MQWSIQMKVLLHFLSSGTARWLDKYSSYTAETTQVLVNKLFNIVPHAALVDFVFFTMLKVSGW